MAAGLKHESREVLGDRALFQVFFKDKVRYTKMIEKLLYHRLLHFEFKSTLHHQDTNPCGARNARINQRRKCHGGS